MIKTIDTRARALKWLWLAAAGAVLAGCAAPRHTPAPVEERLGARQGVVVTDPARTAPLPGAENAGKPGYYTVRPGDTLLDDHVHRLAPR